MEDFGGTLPIAVGLILVFACAVVFVREIKRRNYADKTYSELFDDYISQKKGPRAPRPKKGGKRAGSPCVPNSSSSSQSESLGNITLPEMGRMMSYSDMRKAMKLAFTPVKKPQGDKEGLESGGE